jgi:hypothetical protein
MKLNNEYPFWEVLCMPYMRTYLAQVHHDSLRVAGFSLPSVIGVILVGRGCGDICCDVGSR